MEICKVVSNVMNPQIHILISSLSARGRALHAGREVVQVLRSAKWNVTATVTRSSQDVVLAAADAPQGYVGAVGGDGYMAAVAQGLANDPNRILVPFPGGRGNDLCRALGVGVNPRQRALDLTYTDIDSRITTLDGMWIGEANHLALGVVSLGIDSLANQIANQSRLRWGPLAYAWGGISSFTRFSPMDFQVVIDGAEYDLPGWVCSISNSGWIGGGINIVPSSNPCDGILEVLQVEPTSRVNALPLLAKVLGGRSLNTDLLHIYSGQEISILQPVGLRAMADGDLVATVPFTIRLARGVVRVLV